MTKIAKLTTGLAIATIALVLALVLASPPAVAEAADSTSSDGASMFVSQKCQTCHSVSTAGIEAKVKKGPMAGPDLAVAAKRHDAEWIQAFVKGKEQLDGKKHKKPFKGSDDDLKTVVDWLLSQPTP